MTNIMKLIIYKMSNDAVPPGGGVQAAMDFLTQPGARQAGMRKASDWAHLAIGVIRKAKDPNPYKTMTDEEIAGVILAEVDKRKKR